MKFTTQTTKKFAFFITIIGITFVTGFYLWSAGYGRVFPDLDLVVSLPPSFHPGKTQDFLVYAFDKVRGNLRQYLDLKWSLHSSEDKEIAKDFLKEINSGQYIGVMNLPKNLNEGTYVIKIYFSRDNSRENFSFPVRVERDFRLGVLPRQEVCYAGETVRFDLGSLDPVHNKPFFGAPIRCSVKTPWGMKTVNRLVRTNLRGLEAFSAFFHSLTPAGIYSFSFSGGGRTISFDLPVLPPRNQVLRFCQGLARELNFFIKFVSSVLPVAISSALRIFPDYPAIHGGADASVTGKWDWKGKKLGNFLSLSLGNDGETLRVGIPKEMKGPVFGYELWVCDRLQFHELGTQIPNPLEFKVKSQFSASFPVRVVIWERRPEGIVAWDGAIPPKIDCQAVELFWGMLNLPYGQSNVSALVSQVFHDGPGQLFEGIISSSMNDIRNSHRKAVFILFLMLLIFGLSGYWSFGKDSVAGEQRFFGKFFFLLYFFYAFVWITPGDWVSAASLIVFMVLTTILLKSRSGEFKFFRSPEDTGLVIFGQILSFVWLLFHFSGPIPGLEALHPLVFFFSFFFILGGLTVSLLIFRRGSGSDEGRFRKFSSRLDEILFPIVSFSISGVFVQVFLFTIICLMLFRGFSIVLTAPGEPKEELIERPKASLDKFQADFVFQSRVDERILPVPDSNQKVQDVPSMPYSNAIFNRFVMFSDHLAHRIRRFRSLKVFLSFDEFLMRLVETLQFRPPTMRSLIQEGMARTALVPFLNQYSSARQMVFLEGCLPAISFRLREKRILEPRNPRDITLGLRTLVHRLSACIDVDRQLLKENPLSEEINRDTINVRDWLNIHVEDERSSQNVFFPENELFQIFHGGGTILLLNNLKKEGGLPFPLLSESLLLERGISFPNDFDVKAIEIRRTQPLVVEFVF